MSDQELIDAVKLMIAQTEGDQQLSLILDLSELYDTILAEGGQLSDADLINSVQLNRDMTERLIDIADEDEIESLTQQIADYDSEIARLNKVLSPPIQEKTINSYVWEDILPFVSDTFLGVTENMPVERDLVLGGVRGLSKIGEGINQLSALKYQDGDRYDDIVDYGIAFDQYVDDNKNTSIVPAIGEIGAQSLLAAPLFRFPTLLNPTISAKGLLSNLSTGAMGRNAGAGAIVSGVQPTTHESDKLSNALFGGVTGALPTTLLGNAVSGVGRVGGGIASKLTGLDNMVEKIANKPTTAYANRSNSATVERASDLIDAMVGGKAYQPNSQMFTKTGGDYLRKPSVDHNAIETLVFPGPIQSTNTKVLTDQLAETLKQYPNTLGNAVQQGISDVLTGGKLVNSVTHYEDLD